MFPIPKNEQFGENTEMLKEILDRIDSRLRAVKLTESAAAKKAGLSDSAIRDIRRAVKAGDERGVSSRTLIALAPVLQTTAAWLLEECGPEHVPGQTEQIQKLLVQIASKMPPEARERIVDQLEWEVSRYS